MKPLVLATVLGLATLLSACGQKNQADEKTTANATPAAPDTSAISSEMDDMAMPAEPRKAARGTGTVKAIDKAAGTITLDHDPIPEASWPAMTMEFKARPALLDSVAVGDKVAFDLVLQDGGGEVTDITTQ